MGDRRTRIIKYIEGRLRNLVDGGKDDRSSRVTRIFEVFSRERRVAPKKVKPL
jgi:hypothetical protein